MSEKKETKQKKAEAYEMEEVDSPNFLRFENIGDSVEGTLREVSRSEQFNIGIYTLEKDDGCSVRVHGCVDLDDKMSLIAKGTWLRIEYFDQRKMPKGTMKLFKVYRRKTVLQETG